MKYIKQYENNMSDKVKPGDYVLVSRKGARIEPFLNKKVGIYHSENGYNKIIIVYPDVPEKLRQYFFYGNEKYYDYFNPEEIVFYSPNKEDVVDYIELMNNANKYNL
jgi:hypothetical protein